MNKGFILIVLVLFVKSSFSQELIIGSGLNNDELTIISGINDTLFSGVITSMDDIDLVGPAIEITKQDKRIIIFVNSIPVSTLSIDKSILRRKHFIQIDFNYATINKVRYLVNIDYEIGKNKSR